MLMRKLSFGERASAFLGFGKNRIDMIACFLSKIARQFPSQDAGVDRIIKRAEHVLRFGKSRVIGPDASLRHQGTEKLDLIT